MATPADQHDEHMSDVGSQPPSGGASPVQGPAPSRQARLQPASSQEQARMELGGPFAIFFSSIVLLVFGGLAALVRDGEVLGFDRAIFEMLRSAEEPGRGLGPQWLEIAMINITSLGSHAVLILFVLIVCGYLLLRGKRAAAILVLLAAVGSGVLSAVLKIWFDRPRPPSLGHLVEVSSASFPSGHALLSASIYLMLGALLARTESQRGLKLYFGAVAATLTVLIGLSRIYLGVHWPSDVLAGWCIGSAWALLCWLLAARLQQRGIVESSAQQT